MDALIALARTYLPLRSRTAGWSRAATGMPACAPRHVMTMGSVPTTMVVGYASLSTRMGVVDAQIATMTRLMERSIRADEQLQVMRTQATKLEERLERLEQW